LGDRVGEDLRDPLKGLRTLSRLEFPGRFAGTSRAASVSAWCRPSLIELREASLAPATRRAYERDFRTFAAWCAAHRQRPLQAGPAAVAAFLTAEAAREFRPMKIVRRASGPVDEVRERRGRDGLGPCAG
jgi:hypothetical protein